MLTRVGFDRTRSPRRPAELGRRASEEPPECEREVTVTRKAKVQRERGEIVHMRQLHQRTAETKLRQVRMERHALEPAEHIGEVRRRGADCACHIRELQALPKICVEQIFRAANEAPGLGRVYPHWWRQAQRVRHETNEHLARLKLGEVFVLRPVEHVRAEALQMRRNAAGPGGEERVSFELETHGLGGIAHRLDMRRDDELREPLRAQLPDPERFPPSNEKDLVRVAHHHFARDVPRERAAKRERDLKIGGIVLPRDAWEGVTFNTFDTSGL